MNRTAMIGLAALLCATGCQRPGKPATKESPPKEAGFVVVAKGPFRLSRELSGRVKASLSADVRPQVDGIITDMCFREGEYVTEGQTLYMLDDGAYQAAFDQARAALKKAEANYSALRAKNDRYANLHQDDVVTAQEMDNVRSDCLQAEAGVMECMALLDAARINLGHTRIQAPISGHIGISKYTIGALVNANQAGAMTTIHAIDTVFVDMTRPADRMRDMGGEATLKFDDGGLYPHKGRLELQEIAVNESTGTLTLRASFPNPEGDLKPGMYVRAIVDAGVVEDAILADQRGITWDNKGNATALVINAEDVVEKRVVQTAGTFGGQWLVREGLHHGDRLVVEGTGKIRSGSKVSPVEAVGRE